MSLSLIDLLFKFTYTQLQILKYNFLVLPCAFTQTGNKKEQLRLYKTELDDTIDLM